MTTRDAPRSDAHGARPRGRPARQHLLTEAGRARVARLGDAEDHVADLAVAALRRLAEVGGSEAVREFARERAMALVGAHRSGILATAPGPQRVAAVAAALSAEGYAASARAAAVGGADSRGAAGEQLCQHHCPVARVASEFPQFCETEGEVIAELLGTHVQRLSTIARGDAACTTHVPAPGSTRDRADRSTRDGSSGPAGNTVTTSTVVTGRQVV